MMFFCTFANFQKDPRNFRECKISSTKKQETKTNYIY